ncbi:MAG: response regulator transcription factor [Myxococcaceae bacterium]|nr:response regulator transcription factor [Myxococcaceae bacterium]
MRDVGQGAGWWLLEDRRLGGAPLRRVAREHGHAAARVIHEPGALLTALGQQLPAAVVIDLSHERRDRRWVIGVLAERYPTVRVLVAATGADRRFAQQLGLLGADAVCASGHELSMALARVHRRRRARTRERSVRPPLGRLEGLTPRERQVLGEIGGGCDNLTVAAVLGISERTVKAHVTQLFRKLGARNRVELALAARAAA